MNGMLVCFFFFIYGYSSYNSYIWLSIVIGWEGSSIKIEHKNPTSGLTAMPHALYVVHSRPMRWWWWWCSLWCLFGYWYTTCCGLMCKKNSPWGKFIHSFDKQYTTAKSLYCSIWMITVWQEQFLPSQASQEYQHLWTFLWQKHVCSHWSPMTSLSLSDILAELWGWCSGPQLHHTAHRWRNGGFQRQRPGHSAWHDGVHRLHPGAVPTPGSPTFC